MYRGSQGALSTILAFSCFWRDVQGRGGRFVSSSALRERASVEEDAHLHCPAGGYGRGGGGGSKYDGRWLPPAAVLSAPPPAHLLALR